MYHRAVASPTEIDARPFTLRALKRKFELGLFAIPELQREFVWNEAKIPQLLDSIYRGFPIGSALVWRTQRRNQHLLRKKLHILPDFHPENAEIWYLVDGQQRLSVLWQLVRDPGEAVEIGRRKIDFRNVYFRLRPDDDERFVFRRRTPKEPAVRVVDILSDRWRRRLRGHGVRDLRRIRECRDRLLAYPVWLMFVGTDDLDDVRDTFVRINSLGTPIRAADRAFARATSVNLRGLVRELQDQLGHGFDALAEETILQAAGLVLGSQDVGARAIDRLVREADGTDRGRRTIRRLWASLAPSFGTAVDYLAQHFGVLHLSHLPSETMVAVLAAFFHFNGRHRPSRAAKKQIHHWFWATAVGGRYTGRGFRQNLVRDVALMKRLAERGTGRFSAEKIPPDEISRTDYARPGALTNAFFCMLRLHGPRYLEDGEPIPVERFVARGNRSDKHHVFPRALLRRKGVPTRKINSLPNVCFLVARENQSVGRRHPAEYLEEVPTGGWARRQALRSHLIPTDRDWLEEPSVKRGFALFVERRTRLITRELERLAGAKLFAKN